MMLKKLAILSLISAAGMANAATATGQFTVSASVSANCAVSSASALSFTAFTPDAAEQKASTTLGVKCSNGTSFNIGLSNGTGTGATTAVRKMTNGSATLNYGLYSNEQGTTVWGNTVGTNTVPGTGTGFTNAVNNTIYGVIPQQPDAAPGSYSDTITVTVYY